MNVWSRNAILKSVAVLLLMSAQRAHSENSPGESGELKSGVVELVQQLGDDQYQVRQRAEKMLLAKGKEILPLLEKLGEPGDPEAGIRYRRVLNSFRIHPLQGTKWFVVHTSKVSVKDMTIEFVEGGKFRCLDSPQQSPENETWDEPEAHPDGEIIRFHFNDKYSTYQGHRVDSRTIVGTSKNIKGVTWTWRATLVDDQD